MDVASLQLAVADLWQGPPPWEHPLAVLDLAADEPLPGKLPLPPCPVIGLGDRASPLAALVDAVIEPPFRLESVAAQVLAHPRAAAVVVQLLRRLPEMAAQQGLAAESLAYGLLQGSAEHAGWLAGRDQPLVPLPGAVQRERRDDRLDLVLDNVAQGNAIDRTMRDALFEGLELAVLDESIARIVLRGAGRCFSLGAELSEFGTTRDPAMAHTIRQQTLPAHMACQLTARFEAQVQGACLGAGLELAAWAGQVTAHKDAWFQLPELAMGVLPGAGGCVSLTRRIGRQRTALLILSGRRINARQALDWGLVDAVVDHLPAN